MAFIEVVDIEKSYKTNYVLKKVSCSLEKGEVIGLVGPNGTGKTTLLEIMMTIRKADKGKVIIGGLDTVKHLDEVRSKMGIVLQQGGMYNFIKVKEAIDLFGSIYGASKERKKEIIEQFDLQEHLNTKFTKLSGGWRQRALLATAFIANPEILFLDEPTTGLDPHASKKLWEMIKAQRSKERVIFLSTHSMEEIDRYCDRVIVLIEGRIVEFDTPKNLKEKYNKEYFEDVYFELLEGGKKNAE